MPVDKLKVVMGVYEGRPLKPYEVKALRKSDLAEMVNDLQEDLKNATLRAEEYRAMLIEHGIMEMEK